MNNIYCYILKKNLQTFWIVIFKKCFSKEIYIVEMYGYCSVIFLLDLSILSRIEDNETFKIMYIDNKKYYAISCSL